MTSRNKIQFAKLSKEMVTSKAYQKLTATGYRILSYALLELRWELITKRSKTKSRWECVNKDNIKILYKVLSKEPYCIPEKSITRGIDDLLAKGFITINRQGGMQKGHASTYGMSEKYLTWKPGDDPIETRQPYHARGFCKQSNTNAI